MFFFPASQPAIKSIQFFIVHVICELYQRIFFFFFLTFYCCCCYYFFSHSYKICFVLQKYHIAVCYGITMMSESKVEGRIDIKLKKSII